MTFPHSPMPGPRPGPPPGGFRPGPPPAGPRPAPGPGRFEPAPAQHERNEDAESHGGQEPRDEADGYLAEVEPRTAAEDAGAQSGDEADGVDGEPRGEAEGYGEVDGYGEEQQRGGGAGLDGGAGPSTGHPAVDGVLRSLANAARLAPADQIAEYEAAHQVLQETLASIDG